MHRKCGYSNFNHRYNVSPVHLHAFLGVGNCTKVVRVCIDRLSIGQRVPKVSHTEKVYRNNQRALDSSEIELQNNILEIT
jgi:hypothetical protein